jgi:3-demethoxyubiquinol 3-hydroxylase
MIVGRSSNANREYMTTTFADRLVGRVDQFLRAVLAPPVATRPQPRPAAPEEPLSAADRRHAGGLMRVNHVGEVCAQALYAGQAVATRSDGLRRIFTDAAREEADHLAWTAARLQQLGSRPSVLNPAWYAGSFVFGWLAGKAGDAVSLGFVVETERQVEEHLAKHLETLPEGDHASRAIVDAMRADEAAHRLMAERAGAKVMTTTAYWV